MARRKTYAYNDETYGEDKDDGPFSVQLLDREPETTGQTEPVATVNPEDDPCVLEEFKVVNPKLNLLRLKSWIKLSVSRGWKPGQEVPDYNIPLVTFNEKGEPVIECLDYGGVHGAFHTASKLLPKNVGARFWWKYRPSGHMAVYTLTYSSDKAYQNLQLHKHAQDVDFELLEKITGDTHDYKILKGIKAYNDKLLSDALVRMTARAQAVIYKDDLKKQTGVLDQETAGYAKQTVDLQAANAKADAANKIAENDKAARLKGPVHDQLNAAIKQLRSEINTVPLGIKAIEYTTSTILSPVPHIPVEFLYKIAQHLFLGFCEELTTKPEEEIDTRILNLVTSQFSTEYKLGELKGVFMGMWQWVEDTAKMLWEIAVGAFELVKKIAEKTALFPFNLAYYAATDMRSDIHKAYDKIHKAENWLSEHWGEIVSFLKDMMAGSGQNLEDIEDKIKNQAYGLAEKGGGKIAQKIYEFAGKSSFDMGEAVGQLEGYVLPDILLAVFSEGIGTAIRESFLLIKDFIEAGRAGTMTLEVFLAAKKAYTVIMEMIETAKVFANGAHAEMKAALKEMMEGIKDMLGISEKPLLEAGRLKNFEDEAKVLGKLGKRADEGAMKEANETAAKRVEEAGEKDAKRALAKTKVLTEAIVLTEQDQLTDVPINFVKNELDSLANANLDARVRFHVLGSDPYIIWMEGSWILVDPLYTIHSHRGIEFGDGNRKLKPGKKPEELTNFEKKVSDHIGKSGDRILGSGDEGVREALGIPPKTEQINDFLSVSEGGAFNIAEVKGAGVGSQVEIRTALDQMEGGYKALMEKLPSAKIGSYTIYAPEGAIFENGFYKKGLGDLLMFGNDLGGYKLYRTPSGDVVHCVFLK